MGFMNPVTQVSAALGRWGLGAFLGQTFGGARDIYKVFGYKVRLQQGDFLAKYLRQDVATRCINAPVDATWTDHPTLITKDNTAWSDAWKNFAHDNNIYPIIRKADIFCGLGMFAILVLGFDDGQALETPVRKGTNRKLLYLQPYLEGSVQITEFEENSSSPRFGQPVMYEVTPGDVMQSVLNQTAKFQLRKKFKVHYSRVLHLADNTLENNIFGHSRLEPIYNTLDDLQKVAGGSAETYWLTANRGVHVNLDKDMELDADDAKDLSEEIDEYQHQLRRIIRTRGAKIESIGSDTPSPRDPFSVCIALLSAQTGIPQRVLMGAEAGQLASQQDRANWASRCNERNNNFAGPVILRPFVQKMVDAGCIPPVERYDIEWPDPFKMNPLERAQTSAQMARSAVNIVRAMETAQKGGYDVMAIEEARAIIAPGNRMPIFNGLASGTMIPTRDVIPVDPLDQASIDSIESADSDSGADGEEESDEEEEEDRQENVRERNTNE